VPDNLIAFLRNRVDDAAESQNGAKFSSVKALQCVVATPEGQWNERQTQSRRRSPCVPAGSICHFQSRSRKFGPDRQLYAFL